MANRQKGPKMKKEIERLRALGHGKKAVARFLKVSRNTIRKYWDEPERKAEASAALYVAPWSKHVDWTALQKAISLGQSLSDFWEEYTGQLGPDHNLKLIPYITFWREYRRRYPQIDLVMHKTYQPGVRMEADYKGREIAFGYVDRTTGEWIQLELFGAALCFSQLFYGEATETQTQKDWLMGTQGAFRYFGGVTETAGIDNATVSVKKAHFYDPDVNPEYWKFSEHYNFAPIPTKPGEPTHKAVIENLLGVFWRWVRPRFRRRTFFSKAEVNRFLVEMCDEFNNRRQKKYGSSRRERFNSAEKEMLKPLPEAAYEIADWQKAKLHADCHIQVKKNFYSAPYNLRPQELDVRVSPSFVEIFHRLERVAVHVRFPDNQQGRYQTDFKHLPLAHQAMLEYTPQHVLSEASKIGAETFAVVERAITKARHPLLFLRRCQGIVRLKSRVGADNLERACQTVNHLEIKFPRLKEIEDIAKAPVPVEPKPVKRAANPYLRGQMTWSFNQEETHDHIKH